MSAVLADILRMVESVGSLGKVPTCWVIPTEWAPDMPPLSLPGGDFVMTFADATRFQAMYPPADAVFGTIALMRFKEVGFGGEGGSDQ